MQQINLNHAIAGTYQLSEEDIDSIMTLLTSRCNPRTKAAIRAALMFIQYKESHGVYERVIKHPKGHWQYVAGQLYRDEVSIVRSLLRGW